MFGRDTLLIRTLRPIYALLLTGVSGGQGYLRVINGSTPLFANPRHLSALPPVYEPSVFEYLRTHVQPGAQSLNVGAHVGVFALGLATWSAPDGHVWAFEPNPVTRAILVDHVARNRMTRTISISGDAISDHEGEARFFAEASAGTSRLGQPHPEASARHTELTVPLTTMDTLCGHLQITPDWIVMDIEGFEAAALRGARRTIQNAPNVRVVLELHPHLWESAGSSREEVERVFQELGLEIVDVLQGQSDPFSIPGVVVLARRVGTS